MNTIWDIFLFFNFVTDQARNGIVTPPHATQALLVGQLALFKHYWGDGKELSPASTDALFPFSKAVPLTSSTTGLITLPADFAHIRAFTTGSGTTYQNYGTLLHTEAEDAQKSVLYPIADKPRWIADAGGLQLFPAKATNGTLHYYSKPLDPVIGYTTSGDDPAYNASSSVQLQFAKQYWIEVVLKALPYIGVNLSDPEVFALAGQFQPQAQPA